MIRHRCPNCEEVIPSPDELAGMPILCPYCRAAHVEVPRETPPDIPPLHNSGAIATMKAVPATVAAPDESDAIRPPTSLRWLWPLGLAVLTFALAVMTRIQLSALDAQGGNAPTAGLYGRIYRDFGVHTPVVVLVGFAILFLGWAIVRFMENLTGNEE
jgi:hypothetical protein